LLLLKILTYYSVLHKADILKHSEWIVYIGVVFKAITQATATRDSHYRTCLGHLGQIDSQGKYIQCDIAGVLMPNIALNIADVNWLNLNSTSPPFALVEDSS
jgi:hypothetical protein